MAKTITMENNKDQDIKRDLAILKLELKQNNAKYNKLLKGFNELIDDHISALERLGEIDETQIRYDYFEKAGILE